MQRKFSERFKARMVGRMSGPRGITANALSKEVGIHQSTLSRWLRAAGSVASVSDSNDEKETPRRPEDWSPQEKLEAVMEATGVAEADLGVWLRRSGLKEQHLQQWRELALSGFSARPSRGNAEERRKIQSLEKELKRKDKALAETAALLVLQGKMEALWVAEDDATRQSSDEPSSRASRKRNKRGRG